MATELRFNAQGLIPTIVQDSRTKEVLMVAYMNQQSLEHTRETGQAWFWSRSRQELWHKGATSGNYLNVERIIADCDRDTLLLQVEPAGPTCHTGAVSCFHNTIQGQQVSSPGLLIAGHETEFHNASETLLEQDGNILEEVFSVIESRREQMPPGSYVTKLFQDGLDRIAQKVGEEGVEVVIAAKNDDKQALIGEMADLWFHSLILLAARDLRPADIWEKLEQRALHRGPGK